MRLYVYCEGYTERDFVNYVLKPYLEKYRIDVTPIVCETSSTGIKKGKGGISKYSKIKDELYRICREHKNEIVTTMIDFYGLPQDTPGIGRMTEDVERSISEDLNQQNLIVYLSKHEFEALLFSNVDAFKTLYPKAWINCLKSGTGFLLLKTSTTLPTPLLLNA